MVQFESVGKDYGDFIALHDISFTIPRGGIIGLLGPNGAGKTTTMRIMTGYLSQSRGSVWIDEQPFSPDVIQLKQKIGYLPESAPMYDDMLAWDYLTYEARLHGVDASVRVPEVIRQVGLQSHAHMTIRALSKGYRQRVGIAHTLLHDPDILILDEPTNGLDPNQIREVRNMIRRISKTKTVILSTHIMQEVEALCSKVIVINKGRIIFDGDINKLGATGQQIAVLAGSAAQAGLKKCLRALQGVEHVSVEKAQERGLLLATVSADDTQDIRPAIFQAAVSEGFVIYEMKRERRSVETMFHELTQEDENAK